MSIDLDSVYFPAAGDNIWWGAFKISGTGGFYGGLRAQPPHSISRTDYDFLKGTMPIVLEADVHPEDLLFDDYRYPNLCCVVLYFFPCETDERSTENYSRLFELLDTEKSVMISYIGEMELVIFTSNQLHPDHREVAERSIREQFLWCIIRPQTFSSSSPSCSSSVDMEDKEGSNVDGDHGENRTNNGQVTRDEESCGEISKRCEEEEPKANPIDTKSG